MTEITLILPDDTYRRTEAAVEAILAAAPMLGVDDALDIIFTLGLGCVENANGALIP